MTDETYNMLERAVQVQLEAIENLDTESKEGKDALMKSTRLVELLIASDRENLEYYDKEERRRIDEERNKATNETERKKQELTWGRVGLEMAKVVVPLVVSIAGYNVFQKRILKFEETGRISSTAGRELHLPRFFK